MPILCVFHVLIVLSCLIGTVKTALIVSISLFSLFINRLQGLFFLCIFFLKVLRVNTFVFCVIRIWTWLMIWRIWWFSLLENVVCWKRRLRWWVICVRWWPIIWWRVGLKLLFVVFWHFYAQSESYSKQKNYRSICFFRVKNKVNI